MAILNHRTLKNAFIASVLLISVGFAGDYTAPNPTMRQIDSLWRAMYGAPVHQGIVVYNKMSGGKTNNVSRDTLCIMRLVSTNNTATVKNLIKYVQWTGVNNWGVSSAYRISPDGAKIAMQNGEAVSVCDTNGSNLKIIKSVALDVDQLALSWDDSAGVRRIVYSIGFIIVRTVINSTTNAAVKTDTLWNHAWNKDPAAGSTASEYTSINKVGKFLCFDMPAMVNVPVIVNLATQTARNPTNGGDGCQVRMCQDTFGTITYHESTHLTATTIYRWSTNSVLGRVPCPNGQTNNCTDCGNNFYYWCDSDTNFMVQAGDNYQVTSPGCYSKAFIRKGKTTSAKMMYLGDYMAFPALWIDPQPFNPVPTLDRADQPGARVAGKVTWNGSVVTITGTPGRTGNAALHDVQGRIVARSLNRISGICEISTAELPPGLYLLAWQDAGRVMNRMITVTR